MKFRFEKQHLIMIILYFVAMGVDSRTVPHGLGTIHSTVKIRNKSVEAKGLMYSSIIRPS